MKLHAEGVDPSAPTGGGYGWEEDGAFDYEDAPEEVSADSGAADASAADMPAPIAEVTSSWNGEMESLGEQSWFSSLPDTARTAVQEGLRAKIDNFQSGFTGATQKLAESRAQMEETRTRLSEQYRKASAWIDDSQVNKGLQDLQDENEQLRNDFNLYKVEVAAEHRGRIEQLKAEGATERDALRQASAEANEKLSSVQEELDAFKLSQSQQNAWSTVERIKAALPNMFVEGGRFSLEDGVEFTEKGGPAYDELVSLLGTEAITEEQALGYIAHKYPELAPAAAAVSATTPRAAPVRARPDTPPPALAAMTGDGAGARVTSQGDNAPRTFSDSINQGLQQAAQRAGLSVNLGR